MAVHLTGNYENFKIVLYQYDYADEEPFEEGPDPLGLCSKKGEVVEVSTCMLDQAAQYGFSGP